MKTSGFIYQWTDTITGIKYIGRHEGTPDDGYVASGVIFMKEYNIRPTDFVRDILWYSENTTDKEIKKQEEFFLSKIKEDELFFGKNRKYYNQVKSATGFTSSNNPMRKRQIVERMMKTSENNVNCKSVYENTINKYGVEIWKEINSAKMKGNTNAKGNRGKTKSEEHKKKIAESIRKKHQSGNYYQNKPGRKAKS